MTELLRTSRTLVAVWAGLVAATLASWLLGEGGDGPGDEARTAAAIVLAIAFVKVRFVAAHFMEVRHAPLLLRVVLDGWILVVGTTVVVLSLTTGP